MRSFNKKFVSFCRYSNWCALVAIRKTYCFNDQNLPNFTFPRHISLSFCLYRSESQSLQQHRKKNIHASFDIVWCRSLYYLCFIFNGITKFNSLRPIQFSNEFIAIEWDTIMSCSPVKIRCFHFDCTETQKRKSECFFLWNDQKWDCSCCIYTIRRKGKLRFGAKEERKRWIIWKIGRNDHLKWMELRLKIRQKVIDFVDTLLKFPQNDSLFL